jgi:hypothetical protein
MVDTPFLVVANAMRVLTEHAQVRDGGVTGLDRDSLVRHLLGAE